MRSLICLLAVVALASAIVIPRGNAALLRGALCKPCIDIITNGENNAETDFNTWYEKEVNAVCSDLGFLKNECVDYFKKYEREFDHFITTKADPKTSCQSIDFC